MKKLIYLFLMVAIFVTPLSGFAQADQTANRAMLQSLLNQVMELQKILMRLITERGGQGGAKVSDTGQGVVFGSSKFVIPNNWTATKRYGGAGQFRGWNLSGPEGYITIGPSSMVYSCSDLKNIKPDICVDQLIFAYAEKPNSQLTKIFEKY